MVAATITAQTLENADRLNAEGDFLEAAEQYRAVLATDSDNSQAW